jgi:hypothetical protein
MTEEISGGIRIKKLSKDLHRRFKSACALRNITMNDRLFKLIRQDTEAAERAALRKAKRKES